MKKIFIISFLTIIGFGSCKKADTPVTPATTTPIVRYTYRWDYQKVNSTDKTVYRGSGCYTEQEMINYKILHPEIYNVKQYGTC